MKDAIPSNSNNPTTLDQVLRRRAAQSPTEPVLCEYRADAGGAEATWFSAADIDGLARRIGRRLLRDGAEGDRVLICLPLGHAFAAAFFGCLYANRVAVPVPVSAGFSHERRRIAAIVRDSGATALLTAARFEPDLADSLRDQGHTLPLLSVDTLDDRELSDDELTGDHAERLALLQYTSGSTGDPKGVMLSHRNLLANTDAIAQALGLRRGVRVGGWLPSHHDMGLIGHLLTPIVLDGTTVCMEPMTFLRRPHLWLRMIDDMDITVSAAPSFAYRLCTRRVTDAHMPGLDLSRWEVALNGSEPVSLSVMDAFTARFAAAGFRPHAFAPAYGLAESALLVSGCARRTPVPRTPSADASRPHDDVRPVVSCGHPSNADVRIVDPESREVLTDGRVGEIWVQSDSVARGYWGAAQATGKTFGGTTSCGEKGFLRTGDLGFLHDGELHISGRIKETIVIRGRKLHPHDLEEEISLAHSSLKSGTGAAFSVADEAGSEQLVVVYETAAGTREEAMPELSTTVRRTLAKEFGVDLGALLLVRPGQVQRSTSGKIARTEMRRRFLANDITSLHAHVSRELAEIRAPRPQVEETHA